MLEVEGLSTGYNKLKVLEEVSLNVEDAEIIGILGPNGAGKTTCFRTIFGIIDAWEGTITFNDESIEGLSPHQIALKGLAWVMEGQRIFNDMTVEENLEIAGHSQDNIAGLMSQVYADFPVLEEKKAVKAKTLSGGQMEMLEVGMAFMLDPELILLDEPSLGLAPQIRQTVYERIVESRDSHGISFLIVEQDINELIECADKIYVLRQGRVAASGAPEDFTREELASYMV